MLVLRARFSGIFMMNFSPMKYFKLVFLGLLLMLQGCAFEAPYEIVAGLEYPPVNVAVSAEGRIFLSFQSGPFKVGELKQDGEVVPVGASIPLAAVYGLKVTEEGILWMLDAGSEGKASQLVAWDVKKDELVRSIQLSSRENKPLFFQDFALDQTHGMAYLADMGFSWSEPVSTPALWRVDLETGELKLLLNDDPRFRSELPALVMNGEPFVAMGPEGVIDPDFGLNPITIDSSDEWVYFGAMKGTQLYRLSTGNLMADLSQEVLASKILPVAKKPYSDGISIDEEANVYVTDLQASGIGVVEAGGKYRLLFSDESVIRWPDGLSCGPDGWIYATTNQNHLNAAYNGGRQEAMPPYHVIRFRALGDCRVGR